MWRKNKQNTFYFPLPYDSLVSILPMQKGQALGCHVTHIQQPWPAGRGCTFSVASSHHCWYTSASPHKSIIYGSCFPKIGIRKARAVLNADSKGYTSVHIFIACLGFYRHHNNQGAWRSQWLFGHILSLWMFREEILKLCVQETNTTY